MGMLPMNVDGNERVIAFLNESNRIESITEIDYHRPEFRQPGRGHYGAFVLSQEAALQRQPLTVKMLRTWHKMIAEEQIPLGYHLDADAIGQLRGPALPKNVRVGKHIPPDHSLVPARISIFLEELN